MFKFANLSIICQGLLFGVALGFLLGQIAHAADTSLTGAQSLQHSDSLSLASADNRLPLMPYPASVQRQLGAFVLQSSPTEKSNLQLKVWLAPAAPDAPEASSGRYLFEHLQARLSAQADRAITLVEVQQAEQAQLQLSFQQHIQIPMPGDDEGYQLEVTPTAISINAATSTGALYGIETLAQLLDCQSECQFPAVRINDTPRFAWRGLMLDSARRFIPVADIKRQLQGMAAARLNVFHWHLTDDQGWRFESKHYPKLTSHPTLDNSPSSPFFGYETEFYTQAQMRDVVTTAAKLGIRVVPEIDLPGHASAIGLAYPELMSADRPYLPELKFGIFPAVLDVSSAKVSRFTELLLSEVSAIFPDPYVHIGGDEVKPEEWLANPDIQRYMKTHQLPDAYALHADFNRRLQQQLRQLNKKMMGWDEVLHKDLPKSVLVQSWQGQDAVAKSVKAGHQTLLSAGYYLDMPMPTAYHYRNDPVAVAQPLAPLQGTMADAIQLDFNLVRLNNKPIQGSLMLIPASEQQPAQLRWWVPARGALAPYQLVQQSDLSQQALNHDAAEKESATQTALQPEQWQFSLDSWLGPGEFQLVRVPAKHGEQVPTWQASLWLGNTPYQLDVRQVATDPTLWQLLTQAKPQLSVAEQQLVLGGEAALWTELAPAATLDIKLWPRLFAVAERFWSPAELRDEAWMYQRLKRMEYYGHRLGLQHRSQQTQALSALAANPQELADLQQFSQLIEQAHAYSRHHLKTVRGEYRLGLPLTRLADAVPAESLALVALQQSFTQSCSASSKAADRNQALSKTAESVRTTAAPQAQQATVARLQAQFEQWQQASRRLQQFQGSDLALPNRDDIRQLATQARLTTDIGLQWLLALQTHGSITAQQQAAWLAQLDAFMPQPAEEILQLPATLRAVLQHCVVSK